MKVNELLQVTQTIIEAASKNNFWQTVAQLRTQLQQVKNAQRSPSQPSFQQLPNLKNTLENTRKNVLQALFEIKSSITKLKEIKVYSKSNLDVTFGDKAINLLNRIPHELDTNIDTLYTDISQWSQKVTQYQQFISSISFVLNDFKIDEGFEDLDTLILFFESGATVENLKQLSKVSSDWNQVINCFSRLVKDNDTDTKVISAEQGSLILTVSISSAIILGIIRASDKILDIILKAYEVKKKALELKQMKLAAIDDAITILEKQAKLNVSSEANAITQELLQEYDWNPQGELYEETRGAVSQAVRRMIRFHNTGGKIDSKLPSIVEPEQKEKLDSLRSKNNQFVIAEQEILRLSDSKDILQLEDGMQREDDSHENSTP